MKHLKSINESSIPNINNSKDVDKIIKLIKDQSMEWAYGQGTDPGEERDMVANSFIEGANSVIAILQGDEYWMDLLNSM